MASIFSYFTRHRTLSNLLMVLMLALGFLAATEIRSQFFPDVVSEEIDISVRWSGAGAEDVDAGIVAILEPTLLAVEGVMSSEARSREGIARLELTFEPNWDMTRAADDVQLAIDSVTNLPEDADDPEIVRSTWRDRVTDVVITGPGSVEQLAVYADEFVARLFDVGITRTTIRGVADPEIEVAISQTDMIAYDISMQDIAAAINAHVNVAPLGELASGSSRVRGGIAKQTAAEIEQIILRANADGSQILIGDVARVTDLPLDRNRSYFVGENRALSVRVDRSPSGDAIEIQDAVQAVADQMNAELIDGTEIELIRTRSEAIKSRLNILYENGLLGLVLVVILLFLFLNARTAMWVAIGIPVAMFAAVAFMYVAGITINMVSLFGLIICLGIVVDDAIVVGEHADYRARVLGEPPAVAAENAAARMSMPVFSATITTVIAFFGLTLVGGRFGEFIKDIPYTVIAVLIASVIECFLILPNHMSHSVGRANEQKWYDWPSKTFNKGFVWFRENYFRPFIEWTITLRYPLFAGSVLVLVLSANLLFTDKVPFRFINFPEQDSVSGNFLMLPGATRDDSEAFVSELQRAIWAVADNFEAETGVNPVKFVMGEVGGQSGRSLEGAATKPLDLQGAIAIELLPADERPDTPAFAFIRALQAEVQEPPLLEVFSLRSFRFGPGGTSLSVDLIGGENEVLKAAGDDLISRLEQFPEATGLELDLVFDQDEIVLELTPQGEALGFTVDGLAREMRNRISGIEAADFPDGVRSAQIMVRMEEDALLSDFLETQRLRSPSGEYVLLADIVSAEQRFGFATIKRENGQRIATVSGELSEDNAARAQLVSDTLVNEILPSISADYAIGYRLSGQSVDERQFLSDALKGFLICLLGIFLTLCWIFQSWTRPFVVMAIIPFGFIGAIWGHYYFDVPLSMFSIIGLIGMTGIVVNDSIVLITTIDEYEEKRGLRAALVDAVTQRFRPVLLTTLTTVLGLLPLLYENSQQAQFLKPTIITLAFGLAVGMFIILLIVPCLVMVQHDIGALRASARRLRRSTRLGDVGITRILNKSLFAAALIFAVMLGLGVMDIAPLNDLRMAIGIYAALLAVTFGYAYYRIQKGWISSH